MPVRHVPTVMGIGVTAAAVERLSKTQKAKRKSKAKKRKSRQKGR